MVILKDKIINDINNLILIKDLNISKISVFSMKIFYHVSETLEGMEQIDDKNITKLCAICSDNVECILKSLYKLNSIKNFTEDEIYKLIHNIILTNVKFI